MASAYSILRNYGDYIQPYDFNLIQQGLQYKQQKFDSNQALIQEQINQLSSIQLAKKEDQDYLNERLNTLVQQVNEYGGSADLASNGVTRTIQSHLKQVLDDNVMNAYVGTQNLMRYQKEVEYYKKEKPEQYSRINEMYGMQGAVAWLNDGQAGTKYNGASYSPFIDVNKKLDDVVVNMVKNAPEQVIKIPTRDGYIVEKKVKELNAEEIRTVASQLIDVNDKQQLAINGWYNYGRVSPTIAKETLDSYAKERYTMLDGEVAALELKKQSGVDEVTKNELERQISLLKTQRNNFETRLGRVGNTSDSIGMFLEEEKVIGGLINKNQFREVSIAYENDTSYWNNVEMQYKQMKDARDYELDLRKQGFDEFKFAVETGISYNQGQGTGTGTGLPSGVVSTSRITNPEEEGINPETEIYNTIATTEASRGAIIDDFYDNLNADSKSKFDTALATWKQLPENKGKTDAELKSEVAMNLSNNGQNTDFMPVDTYLKLKTVDNTLRQNKQILVDASNKSALNLEKQADKIFEVALNNPNITTYDNIGGTLVKKSYAQYLREKGINNFDQLKQNKEEYNKLLSQSQADLMFSSLGMASQDERVKAYSGGALLNPEDLKEKLPEIQYYLNQIAKRNGESVSFEDVFDVDTRRVLSSGDLPRQTRDKQFITLKGNSSNAPKTLAMLKSIYRTDSFDTSYGFSDDSFQDDRTSKNILSYGASKQAYDDYLNQTYQNLPQNKMIGLKAKTPIHREAVQIASTAEGGFNVTEGDDISVYSSPDGQNLIIRQIQTISKGVKGLVEQPREVTIPVKDLKGTLLGRTINAQNTASKITVDNMIPIQKSNVTFASDSNLDYYEGLKASVFGENSPYLGMVTKQGAVNSLFREYGAFYTDNQGNQTDINKIVNNVINNPNKFTLKVEPNKTKTSINLKINYKDVTGGERVLETLDLKTKTFDEYQAIYDVAPQIFLYMGLKNILDKSISESIMTGGQVPNEQLNQLKSIYNIQ